MANFNCTLLEQRERGIVDFVLLLNTKDYY